MARTPALSQHQPEGMCRPGDSERTCAPPPRTGTNTGPRALLRRDRQQWKCDEITAAVLCFKAQDLDRLGTRIKYSEGNLQTWRSGTISQVFTGNSAAHGQNFKSSAKSEPPTELPGCREWVVSRAQRRAHVTQTDAAVKQADNCLFAPGLIVRFVLTSGPNYPHEARVLFSAILGLPLEQFLKDSPTTIGPICHFCTSLLKRNSVLSKRLSPATSLEVQWRGHRFDLWSGKIPHATEQGSLCARLLKPAQPEQVLHSKGSCHSEKPKYRGEEQPLRPWRPEPQKADVQQRQPSAARRD
ncbi:hypothetical protein MJT46_018797 [Ovis ammon polii x Ovis aries]|nr:hypothetical protein MJT46_018797 [Ovis ammon polii x Ovis aries]